MFKKCSSDQRFIRKRNTTYKIHTLANGVHFTNCWFCLNDQMGTSLCSIPFHSFQNFGTRIAKNQLLMQLKSLKLTCEIEWYCQYWKLFSQFLRKFLSFHLLAGGPDKLRNLRLCCTLLYEMPSNQKGKNFVSKIYCYCPQNTMEQYLQKVMPLENVNK